jgi:hypothetical protein
VCALFNQADLLLLDLLLVLMNICASHEAKTIETFISCTIICKQEVNRKATFFVFNKDNITLLQKKKKR